MLNTREVFTKMVVGMILMPMMFFHGCSQAQKNVDVPLTSQSPSTAAGVPQDLTTQQPPPQAQPLNILFIGDSHTAGTFGDKFSKELAITLHGEVSRYGVSSSTMRHWLGQPPLRSLTVDWAESHVNAQGNEVMRPLKQPGSVPQNFKNYPQLLDQGFDVVVIALGTNDVTNYYSQPQKLAEQAGQMVQMAQGKTVIWVGPPSFTDGSPVINTRGGSQAQYKIAIDLLKQAVESNGGFYIDSREFTFPAAANAGEASTSESVKYCCSGTTPMYPDRRRDRVHFDERGIYWGNCACLAVKEGLSQGKIKLPPGPKRSVSAETADQKKQQAGS